MRSAHCTSRRMLLSKATARSQPILFLFTSRSAADGKTWRLPRSQWHKTAGNDEPNDSIPNFAWRVVSVPDRFAAICWAALGSLVADMILFYLGQRGKTHILRVFPNLESRKRTLPGKLHSRLILRSVRVLTAAKFIPFGTV